jgi:hypothetical protein
MNDLDHANWAEIWENKEKIFGRNAYEMKSLLSDLVLLLTI